MVRSTNKNIEKKKSIIKRKKHTLTGEELRKINNLLKIDKQKVTHISSGDELDAYSELIQHYTPHIEKLKINNNFLYPNKKQMQRNVSGSFVSKINNGILVGGDVYVRGLSPKENTIKALAHELAHASKLVVEGKDSYKKKKEILVKRFGEEMAYFLHPHERFARGQEERISRLLKEKILNYLGNTRRYQTINRLGHSNLKRNLKSLRNIPTSQKRLLGTERFFKR